MIFVSKYRNDIYGAIIGAIVGYLSASYLKINPVLSVLIVALSFGFLCGIPRRRVRFQEGRRKRLENDTPNTANDPGSYSLAGYSETSYDSDDRSDNDHSWDSPGIDSTGYDSGGDAGGDGGGGDGGGD